MDLLDEGMCFICGQRNPVGLKVDFQVEREKLELKGSFTPRREHQGYKGIMHGGLVAALLDEAMVKLLWEAGIPAVSASLEVKLTRPVSIGQMICIRGWVDSRKGRLIRTAASIEDEEGNVLARGRGKCVIVSSKEAKGVRSKG